MTRKKSSRTFFIDAVVWIALFNSNDKKHKKAVELMKRILGQIDKAQKSLFLSEYVFSEVLGHVTVRQKQQKVTEVERKKYVSGVFAAIYDSRYVKILVAKPSDLGTAFEYMRNHSDITASLTDWMSVILVKRYNIHELLTTDSDLEKITKQIPAFSSVKVQLVNLNP